MTNNNYQYNYIALAMGLLLFSLPSTVMAADIQTIMTRLQEVLGPLVSLLLVICYVSGIGLVFRGLGMLRIFGMPLTHQSRQGEIAGPMVYLAVGSILIWIPTATGIVSETIFGSIPKLFTGTELNFQNMGTASTDLIGYASIEPEGTWSAMLDTIVMYMQFIGFLAFIRGWFIISHAGQPGVQPGSIAKGIVHIIGGILAVNFIPLVNILYNTIFTG